MSNECKGCEWRKKCRQQLALLPEGKTCADCAKILWCGALLGAQQEASTSCVHCPSRFSPGEEGDSHE